VREVCEEEGKGSLGRSWMKLGVLVMVMNEEIAASRVRVT